MSYVYHDRTNVTADNNWFKIARIRKRTIEKEIIDFSEFSVSPFVKLKLTKF